MDWGRGNDSIRDVNISKYDNVCPLVAGSMGIGWSGWKQGRGCRSTKNRPSTIGM